tara:strand:- start:1609 stop:2067 length:459 start_codon:yes stop_codon:yes gene_type:complete
MVLSKRQINNLNEEMQTQVSIWDSEYDKWYKAVAEEKMKDDYIEGRAGALSTIAFDKLANAESELRIIASQIKTHISNAEKNITTKSDMLKNKRNVNSDSINKKQAHIDKNKSSGTRQIDKLDEKSRAYLTTTFYSISLITMSFFIYKQLKQ